MSRHQFVILLVVLNLLLIGGIVYQSARVQPPAPKPLKVLGQTPTNAPPAAVNTPTNRAKPATLQLRWPPFRWADVESADYLELADNLIRIGCPKQTVRDIVLGRIHDDHGRRVWDLMRPLQAEIWKVAANGLELRGWKAAEDLEPAIGKIQAEREAVVDLVLERLGEAPEIPVLPDLERWRFLAPDEFKMVKGVFTHYRQLADEFEQRRIITEDEAIRAEIADQIEQLDRDRTAKLKTLLGPEKWAEYLDRNRLQSRWAEDIEGTGLAPEAIREIAAAREQAVKDALAKLPPDAGRRARARAGENAVESAMGQLTPEQRTAVERGRDHDYQTWRRITRRLNLPAAVADRTWEIKQIAAEQARALRENDKLDAEQRRLAQAALQLQTTRELSDLYGTGWETYLEYGSDWMTRLADE